MCEKCENYEAVLCVLLLLFSVRKYVIIRGAGLPPASSPKRCKYHWQVNDLRIEEHPILDFERKDKISFFYNNEEVEAYPTETIAAALHAAGVRKLGESPELHRPRGLFCAIGNCSSCFMIVNNQPNMRVCVIKVEQGMRVEEQKGKGELQY